MMFGKMRNNHVEDFSACVLAALQRGKGIVMAVVEKPVTLCHLVLATSGIAKSVIERQPFGLGAGAKSEREFVAKPFPWGLARLLVCLPVHLPVRPSVRV